MAELPDSGLRPGAPLRWWERAVSMFVGLAFAGLAILALFISSNQAGTAALVVVAAAFLLIGVQGTALIRLGSGSASVELERKQAALAQRVSEVVEQDPQLALGIVEGAALAEPLLGAGAGAFLVATYKDTVRRAIESVMPVGSTVTHAHRPIDLAVSSGAKKVLVSIIYRRSSRIRQIDLGPLVSDRQMEDAAAGLIVANSSPDQSVTDYIATAAQHGVVIEFVAWKGSGDDRLLAQALARLFE